MVKLRMRVGELEENWTTTIHGWAEDEVGRMGGEWAVTKSSGSVEGEDGEW